MRVWIVNGKHPSINEISSMSSGKVRILWADDEIEMLKPQLFFLEKKGYEIHTVSNGYDALEYLDQDDSVDVVFLDESMPGLNGLETLAQVKEKKPGLPVVMITKNEAENIMESAIGAKISDYLIKPVNPNQILLALKKIVQRDDLIEGVNANKYKEEFRQISMSLLEGPDYNGWVDVYQKFIAHELNLDKGNDPDLKGILTTQKQDANREFFKYVSKHYTQWIKTGNGPLLSHQLMKEKVLPLLSTGKPVVFVLLDNLRFDQWEIIKPIVEKNYRIQSEEAFYSILPSATQYSRNAIFAGMLPAEIQKHYPKWWLNDNEEGGKNLREGELLQEQIRRLVKKDMKVEYVKITNVSSARQLQDNALNYLNNQFTAIVYNFIDMLSHTRTEMEVLKELAGDEKAYRSLTYSWFINSPLWATLQKMAEKDVHVVITTDHGTIRVKNAVKVVGDRETTTNLRYKVGRNMQYDKKEVFEVKNPAEAGLPSPNVSSSFIFAREDSFFLYPNNYNQYLNLYRDTFQHGGISMEEIICPVVKLIPKSRG